MLPKSRDFVCPNDGHLNKRHISKLSPANQLEGFGVSTVFVPELLMMLIKAEFKSIELSIVVSQTVCQTVKHFCVTIYILCQTWTNFDMNLAEVVLLQRAVAT